MKKTITVIQALELNDAINALFNDHIKYDVSVGYRLYQLKNQLDDLCQYIIGRITEVIPKLKENAVELDETENIIYQTTLNSPIEIETFNLTRDEIYQLNQGSDVPKPTIELNFIEKMEALF